ncbi:MAG: hypothetical protein HQL57_07430 [Magnetococcales bacterium]|nr:hypothetical protein [Magnetococcales bacterium]MBF0156999.1 hypothetical protein [Magnetococcales bacterium]
MNKTGIGAFLRGMGSLLDLAPQPKLSVSVKRDGGVVRLLFRVAPDVEERTGEILSALVTDRASGNARGAWSFSRVSLPYQVKDCHGFEIDARHLGDDMRRALDRVSGVVVARHNTGKPLSGCHGPIGGSTEAFVLPRRPDVSDKGATGVSASAVIAGKKPCPHG